MRPRPIAEPAEQGLRHLPRRASRRSGDPERHGQQMQPMKITTPMKRSVITGLPNGDSSDNAILLVQLMNWVWCRNGRGIGPTRRPRHRRAALLALAEAGRGLGVIAIEHPDRAPAVERRAGPGVIIDLVATGRSSIACESRNAYRQACGDERSRRKAFSAVILAKEFHGRILPSFIIRKKGVTSSSHNARPGSRVTQQTVQQESFCGNLATNLRICVICKVL